MVNGSSTVELLGACRAGSAVPAHIVVVAAYPDDEVIGLGARLCCCPRIE